MPVTGKGDPFLVDARHPLRHDLAVVLPEKIRLFALDEVVVGLADDVLLAGAEEAFEALVAGQIDAVGIFEPDEIGQAAEQGVQLGAGVGGMGGVKVADALVFGEFSVLPLQLQHRERQAGAQHRRVKCLAESFGQRG